MSTKSQSDTLYKIMTLVLHIVGCMSFSYAVYYDFTYVRIPREVHSIGSSFGGKFKFLTFWDAILQALYFGVAFINDVIGSTEKAPKKSPLVRRIRDYTFTTFAFPLAMFVGTTFWSLMAIDRELVFPKALDPYFPNWLNHVMHTNIMLFALLEMITSFRAYPRRSQALTGLIMFVFVYLIWVHVIFFASGQWVYPVLEVLNGWQRAVFFLAMISYSCVLYLSGEVLNTYVWAKEVQQGPSGKQHQRKKK